MDPYERIVRVSVIQGKPVIGPSDPRRVNDVVALRPREIDDGVRCVRKKRSAWKPLIPSRISCEESLVSNTAFGRAQAGEEKYAREQRAETKFHLSGAPPRMKLG